MRQNKKGFTLIELMVAMGIIAVLVTMSIVAIQIVQRSLRNTQRRDAGNTLNLAINAYFADYGTFPLSSQVTFSGDSITLDGDEVIELKGPTTAKTETTKDGTQYCYISTDGSSYSLGLSLEGNDWGLQLGNSGTDCTTPAPIN